MLRWTLEQTGRMFLALAASLSICLTLPMVATAQWAASGNDIYNTNSGKVGIGTTSPYTKLDVVGGYARIAAGSNYGLTLRVDDDGGWNSSYFFHDRWGGNWYWRSNGISGEKNYARLHGVNDGGVNHPTFDLYDINSSGGVTARLTSNGTSFLTGGNVGIGTTTPPRTLSVVGTMGMSESGNVCCRLMITTGGSGTVINHNDNSPIFFQTEGTTWLTIKNGTGNVGIGTGAPTAKLDVAGDVVVSGNISAKYQDLAEWVPAAEPIAPGTVVIVDSNGTNTVLPSSHSYDTRVAGVVSATPGITLGEQAEGKVKVATTGRVRVRVNATRSPIRAGDLLVSSDTAGAAMKSEPVAFGGIEIHRPGTLIGKALEHLSEGEGEILVLLSLQ